MLSFTFDDNSLLPALYGREDEHLILLEKNTDTKINYRGNHIEIFGESKNCKNVGLILKNLYRRLKDGSEISLGDVEGELKMINGKKENYDSGPVYINTSKRKIIARSLNQKSYLNLMKENSLVFAIGPAGTGKTYLAVAAAVQSLLNSEVDRIILSRPAVEAGERLGFLPGDLKDKVDPYLRPLYDALYDMLPAEIVFRKLESGEIEVAPLAFMRGRTLANAYIIVDEAQNTTPMQMKMILTRIGENSKMVVTGDLSQIDLSNNQLSGLKQATEILNNIEDIAFIRFNSKDVVRNQLVIKMVEAYENSDKTQNQ
ncbi:MAG: phosphate starvation-inducible protein PhoH [Rhodospirillaceae bacterium]|nr:phosphate starvation-inducible protein PhoH [Rhodospirillaceae bacterium]|tara:strand:- start:1170 stop:2114 length:945 start_codon:yes stop_codon:yes gene_type:complete